MNSAFEDRPHSLGQAAVLRERTSMLHLPHVAPLTSYVRRLRSEIASETGVPYFDPMDGGTKAELLIVLESPGPKAVTSGFVSRNNPDPTAKNLFNALKEEGIARRQSALWNVVPWNLSTSTANRTASGQDVLAGIPHLLDAMRALPNLRHILLAGEKAMTASSVLRSVRGPKIWGCPHFAARAYGHTGFPNLRIKCHEALREIAFDLAN